MAKPTAAKVSVQCPHCAAHQLEPALVQSTYCRACNKHFEIGLLNRQGNSSHENQEGAEPGMWGKISGLFRDHSPRPVSCFQCGARQEVVRTATSSSCKTCGAYIDLQDFKIIGAFSKNIQTAGTVYVTSKGDLSTGRAICGAADIRGSMRGQMVCTGEISVDYKGRITGGVETDSFRVARKSVVEMVRPVRAREVHIEGAMSGRILASGTVHISKTGRVNGAIFAKGINIEQGGEFEGELNIGDNQVEEPSLLPTPPTPRPNTLKTNSQSELGFH